MKFKEATKSAFYGVRSHHTYFQKFNEKLIARRAVGSHVARSLCAHCSRKPNRGRKYWTPQKHSLLFLVAMSYETKVISKMKNG